MKLTPRRCRLLALCMRHGLAVGDDDSDATLAKALIRAGHWPDFAIPNDLDFGGGRFVSLTTDRHVALALQARTHTRRTGHE